MFRGRGAHSRATMRSKQRKVIQEWRKRARVAERVLRELLLREGYAKFKKAKNLGGNMLPERIIQGCVNTIMQTVQGGVLKSMRLMGYFMYSEKKIEPRTVD